MDESVTLLATFGAGVLSFISPCVLPFVPCYLRIVSGRALGDTCSASGTPRPGRGAVMLGAIAFAAGLVITLLGLGFSIAVVELGTAVGVSELQAARVAVLGRASGLIVVLFGLHLLTGLRLPGRGARPTAQARAPAGPLGAGLAGGAFGIGWTPCFGPILAGVLALAGPIETAGQRASLLAAYALGLAAPFVAIPPFASALVSSIGGLRGYGRAVEVAAGVLLITIGVLLVVDRLVTVMGLLPL